MLVVFWFRSRGNDETLLSLHKSGLGEPLCPKRFVSMKRQHIEATKQQQQLCLFAVVQLLLASGSTLHEA